MWRRPAEKLLPRARSGRAARGRRRSGRPSDGLSCRCCGVLLRLPSASRRECGVARCVRLKLALSECVGERRFVRDTFEAAEAEERRKSVEKRAAREEQKADREQT
eukprot:3929354-Rhodomonas_salina.1